MLEEFASHNILSMSLHKCGHNFHLFSYCTGDMAEYIRYTYDLHIKQKNVVCLLQLVWEILLTSDFLFSESQQL